ncbi:hypothetical protein BB560_005952, partial [Smittium megazygosporum]
MVKPIFMATVFASFANALPFNFLKIDNQILSSKTEATISTPYNGYYTQSSYEHYSPHNHNIKSTKSLNEYSTQPSYDEQNHLQKKQIPSILNASENKPSFKRLIKSFNSLGPNKIAAQLIKRGYIDLEGKIYDAILEVLNKRSNSSLLSSLPDVLSLIADCSSSKDTKDIFIALADISTKSDFQAILVQFLTAVDQADFDRLLLVSLDVVKSGAISNILSALKTGTFDDMLREINNSILNGSLDSFFAELSQALYKDSARSIVSYTLNAFKNGCFDTLISSITKVLAEIITGSNTENKEPIPFIKIIQAITDSLNSGKLDNAIKGLVDFLVALTSDGSLSAILGEIKTANSKGDLNEFYKSIVLAIQGGLLDTGNGLKSVMDSLKEIIQAGKLDQVFAAIADGINANIPNSVFSDFIQSIINSIDNGDFQTILDAIISVIGGPEKTFKAIVDTFACFQKAIFNPVNTNSGLVLRDMSVCTLSFITTNLFPTSEYQSDPAPDTGLQQLVQTIIFSLTGLNPVQYNSGNHIGWPELLGKLADAIYQTIGPNRTGGYNMFGKAISGVLNLIYSSEAHSNNGDGMIECIINEIIKLSKLTENQGNYSQNPPLFGLALKEMSQAFVNTMIKTSGLVSNSEI